MRDKNVLLRASVYIAHEGKHSPDRNIRSVEAIYVGDVSNEPDLKIILFKGEMWDYTNMGWIDVYGELAMKLNPGQTFHQPIYVPFDELGNIEWSTNRWDRNFVLGKREL